MQVELADDGRIRLQNAGRTFEITSRTSLPGGAWTRTSPAAQWRKVDAKSNVVKWSGNDYSVSRRVEKRGDHVQVFDTVTNIGTEVAGVIIENRLALPTAAKDVLLAGHSAIGETSSREQPAHPTALAVWKDYAIGLVAEDDIFRVHSRVFTEPRVLGIVRSAFGNRAGAIAHFGMEHLSAAERRLLEFHQRGAAQLGRQFSDRSRWLSMVSVPRRGARPKSSAPG